MRTIQEAARMLREDDPGTAITHNAIRSMVLAGKIPCVRIGCKRLLDYDLMLETLKNPPAHSSAGAGYGTIRRVV